MDEIRQRLINCFVAVFPTINVEHLELVTPGSIEGWDSVATVTLMSVIEEEFEIEIDPENIESLLSFDSALSQVTHILKNQNGA
jgi:acyl carrier protein